MELRDATLLASAVARGADLNARDWMHHFGKACVHVAARGGARSFEMLRMLQRLGADVTAPDGSGRTALHDACRRGEVAVVEELVRLGHA